MMPESVLSSLLLSGSRYYVEPAYLATDRGPFFRTAPGVYTANLQYCFGRPYIDRILLGRQSNGSANAGNRVVLNLENLMRGQGPEAGNRVVYPGKCCVYVYVNPDSGVLDSAAKRRFVLDQVDAEAMVTIFFAGEAELLSRIIPDEFIAFEALAYEAPESSGRRPGEPLVIAFPANEIRLKLVAERLQVDLLVSNVESRLVEYDGTPPVDADLLVTQEFVSSRAPGLSFWKLLSRTLATGQVFDAPWLDELAWFLATEKLNNEQAWLKPLFQADFDIRVPARLKGLRFFSDGTLDFEDAWIEPQRSGR
jgi:MarR-like DNA-binding transcriptional regulator SgrR of sgrS sRNA